MARGQVQSQRAGDGRLPYTAFSHYKSQPGHRVIVSGELDYQRNGRERTRR
jgi:hypothetical protein